VGEELGDDARAPLKVVEGFKERDNGDFTNKTLCGPAGEAGLSGEEVNGEEVREAARHADDERANALAAVFVDVGAEDGVAGEDDFRLAAGIRAGGEERARGAEFGFEEFEAAWLVP
jgi:hypothetical protein